MLIEASLAHGVLEPGADGGISNEGWQATLKK